MIAKYGTKFARVTNVAPAAPTGGACPKGQGWGRGLIGPALALLMLVSVPETLRADQPVTVPSGQSVTLSEVLIDDSVDGSLARFRFLAPAIARDGGTVDFETASNDMADLCVQLVLPYLEKYELDVASVVISMADREVPFGYADPEATQFFESYRPDDGGCIWEPF